MSGSALSAPCWLGWDDITGCGRGDIDIAPTISSATGYTAVRRYLHPITYWGINLTNNIAMAITELSNILPYDWTGVTDRPMTFEKIALLCMRVDNVHGNGPGYLAVPSPYTYCLE